MTRIKNLVLRSVRPIHDKFRKEKIDAFLSLTAGSVERTTLLDVGGGSGINGEFLPLYSLFAKVVVVNLTPQKILAADPGRVQGLVADGRKLPLPDRAFDWVFSNAVIEHVGDYESQIQFANEIRRVASKGYFVACPNKYFPVEPHTLLPFYQFLPKSMQKKVAPYCPGYLKHYEEINLLAASQLQRLFPEATVRAVGFPLFGNSIVACYRRVN